MTTTNNAAVNSRRRPTLSDQIDRLDRTLDGLAEALNEAVGPVGAAGEGGGEHPAGAAA